MYLRSPQVFGGVTAAHLCRECGRQALKAFAANLTNKEEESMAPATAKAT